MKKISALATMVLCLTVGGVYAAWTYTNSAMDIADVNETYTITLTTATEAGAHGEYSIESNIQKLTIEQNGESDPTKDYHKAVLQFHTTDSAAPYIKICLDLAVNAPNDVLDTLETTYEISIRDVVSQYGTDDIFVDHKTGATAKTSITKTDWTEENAAEGIYSYTITDFAAEFELNDFVLESKSAHTAFGVALGNPVLRIDVSDGKLPGAGA